MFQKKLKNPVSVIRKPEEINKEYSELVLKLGQFEIELRAIEKARIQQDEREESIGRHKNEMVDRIQELNDEMNEAQKEIQRKAKEEADKKEEPVK